MPARVAELPALPGGESLVGIRHQVQGESDPEWLVRPDVLRGLAALSGAGLAYDLIVTLDQLPASVRAAAKLPGLTFVLDHLGKPRIVSGETDPWARALRELASLPNTVCKLSGMVTEADLRRWTIADLRPYTDMAMEAFGPDRLMFGSGWPVWTLGGELCRGRQYRPGPHSASHRRGAAWLVRRDRKARLRARSCQLSRAPPVAWSREPAAGTYRT